MHAWLRLCIHPSISLFGCMSCLYVCAEILEEHFTRHAKGGQSTKAIVFTQLRSTVRAIVADLADTKGDRVATDLYLSCGWFCFLHMSCRGFPLLFCSVLFCSVLFCSVLFYSVLFFSLLLCYNHSPSIYVLSLTFYTIHWLICRCVCSGLYWPSL